MQQLRLRENAVAWREVDGEVLILGLESATYFSINQAGGLLWRQLADGVTREDLVTSLVDTFDIDQERASADVAAFLSELESCGLLET